MATVVATGEEIGSPYYTGRAAQQEAIRLARARGEDVTVTRDRRRYAFVAHADGTTSRDLPRR